MNTYWWKFNGEWQELTLRKFTEKSVIFEYPDSGGKPWRMATKTFADYRRLGL